MKKKQRPLEIFNLSFLDVISCGFGAIILLLVIMKVSEPQVVENITQDLSAEIVITQSNIELLQVQLADLSQQISTQKGEHAQLSNHLNLAKEKLQTIESQKNSKEKQYQAQEVINRQLFEAKQDLTDEMLRLQQNKPPKFTESLVGGVPVDSEYIIFIIDTSGSMQQHAWPLVKKKMGEILAIYPKVKGLQVMNDMGDYMFSQYAGKWIRDTPARRKSILKRLSTWQVFSNSSPEEGIVAAIKRFYASDKKISLYIFGDDFSRGTIQNVVSTVNSINKKGNSGRVRIHAVGFPVLFSQTGASGNIMRFSALMRKLAEDNGGSFVGLTELNTSNNK